VGQQNEYEPSSDALVTIAAVSRLSSFLRLSQGHFPGVVPTLVAQTAYIVAVQTVSGSPISLKALVNTVGCTHAGMRKPLQYLLEDGWIAISFDKSDRRVRRAVATDKLLKGLCVLSECIDDRISSVSDP
jgi:hypothetical protein